MAGPFQTRGVETFRRVVVVCAGANPSYDYYFASRLEGRPGPPVEVMDLDAPPSDRDLGDALVIFCRYLSGPWMRAARRARAVALFLDDDMIAILRDGGMGWDYRWRVWRRSVRHWPALRRMLGFVLVSASPLGRRWGGCEVRQLSPLAGAEDLAAPPPAQGRLRLALHQTASHAAEHRWMRSAAAALLAERSDLELEVAASGPLARLWAGDPRIAVVPHRPWPEYRRATAARGCALMLAPLLPSAANAVRSAAKRIDAARMGAALLVSDAAVYEPCEEETRLGMVVPLEPRAWVDAIKALADDRPRLARLAALNRARLQAARASAPALFTPADAAGGWRLA